MLTPFIIVCWQHLWALVLQFGVQKSAYDILLFVGSISHTWVLVTMPYQVTAH